MPSPQGGPGTTQISHMLDNSAAAAVHFTPAEIAELNAAVQAVEVKGQRLPDATRHDDNPVGA